MKQHILNIVTAGLCVLFITNVNAQYYAWADGMGGPNTDEGNSIAVDVAGNVYTTGHFSGTVDFDPGAGTANLTSAGNGNSDIFITKMDAAGDLIWARSMGGTQNDYGLSIAVDGSENVYTTGWFQGTADFDPGVGTDILTSAGSADIFVSKLNAAGDHVWARSMGGVGSDQGTSIAVESARVYTTGIFNATADLDPGTGTANLTSAGSNDIFVSQLDAITGLYSWSKSMGGTSSDIARSIAVDGAGTAHITGDFVGTADFDPDSAITFNLTSAGGADIFVSKLDLLGNLVMAKSMGGTSDDNGLSIAVQASGEIYTTGFFSGTADFDPGPATANLTSVSGTDIFISKLTMTGDNVWAKGMGNSSFASGASIAVDAVGKVYTTGYFRETIDFDTGVGTVELTSAGDYDIYVSKLDAAGDHLWTRRMGSTYPDQGKSIAIDGVGNVHTTGHFKTSVDFDPGPGSAYLASVGSTTDIFIQKLSSTAIGITENSLGSSVTIQPNPSKDAFTIIFAEQNTVGELEIRNMIGQVVFTQRLNGGSSIQINSEWPTGSYLLVLRTDDHIEIERLMVVR